MNAVLKPAPRQPKIEPSRPDPRRLYLAENYFVLRTPLLPVAVWLGEGADAPEPEDALAQLRERWRDAKVRDAVYVASPSLHGRLEAWDWCLRDKKDWKLAGAFYNYLSRMCTRPTPFGLCAAVSLGRVGDGGDFNVDGDDRELRRHTRLDTATVTVLAEQLCQRQHIRHLVRLRCNESGHQVADRWHYVDWRLDGDSRIYSLSSVELSEPLQLVLKAARTGAVSAEFLVNRLCESDDDIDREEAFGFIDELIASRLLIPMLEPCLTGQECLPALIEELGLLDSGLPERQSLVRVNERLNALDQGGLGCSSADYKHVIDAMAPLELSLPTKNQFQVDLYRDAETLCLSDSVADEVARAAELSLRLGNGRGHYLDAFCRQFNERFGGRRVPLLEVLDEEVGIGLDAELAGDSPLLQGVMWRPPATDSSHEDFQRRLLERLTEGGGRIPDEIEIDPDDIPPLDNEARAALAASAHAQATLLAADEQALERGDYRIVMHGVLGPSAANMLGRFGFGHPELVDHLRGSLGREAETRPDAVFAEIVHLPRERLGNLVCRPLFREYEIPVLGRSGAPDDYQIPLDDLEVEVRGQSVLLWSRRLSKQVIPRMSNAHNYNNNALGLYRFLSLVQFHGVTAGGFRFGSAFDALPRLPRVCSGRLILAPARWRLDRRQAKSLLESTQARRPAALEKLRSELSLPRLVGLVEGDNVLAIDFDNPLAVDMLCRQLNKHTRVELIEAHFDPSGLCLGRGRQRFAHELVMPLRANLPSPARPASRPQRRLGELMKVFQPPAAPPSGQVPDEVRNRLPGTDWLYFRLFGTPGQLDRALREVLGPFSEQARQRGDCEQWFFIRYGDPDWHLRWRFQGCPERLNGSVLPALTGVLSGLRRQGWVTRVEIASYEREIERYGGPEAMTLCERWFAQESRRVTALLATLHGGPPAWRWQTAAWCLLQDLTDLGCSRTMVDDLMTWVAAGFRQEFKMEKQRLGSLGNKFRESAEAVARACAGLPPDGIPEPDRLRLIVAQEREQRQAIGQELRDLATTGRLWGSFESLLPSLLHMTCNRWFMDHPRANEMVLYDLLRRGLMAQSKRAD